MRRTPAWPPPIQIAGTAVASLAWTTSVLETPNRRIQAIRVPATWASLPVHFPKAGDFIRIVETARTLAAGKLKKPRQRARFLVFIRLTLGRSRCPVLTAVREALWQSSHRCQQPPGARGC